MERRTRAQRGSALGSKTTHCNPRSMDASMKINSRRKLTYFHAGITGEDASSPHLYTPLLSRKSRITLMLTG